MKEEIRKIGYSLGADVCGFADMNRFNGCQEGFSPFDVYDRCKTVIVVGVALPKGLTEVSSRIIYSHYNNKCIENVDNIAFRLSKIIEEKYNCTAVPLPCDTPYDYWDKEKIEGRGLISMKYAAYQAGIGSIGKNSMLINEIYGNLLTIGTVLTNLSLDSDTYSEDFCVEGCTRCLDSCPVNAISEKKVEQKKCRNYAYGKTTRGFDTVECNKCRVVCPLKYGSLNNKKEAN